MPESKAWASVTFWIKICGVRTRDDVSAARDAGADAVGMNFVEGSPRFLIEPELQTVFDAAQGLERVAVVADPTPSGLAALLRRFPFERVQLHGFESPELLSQLDARCFKAVRVGSHADAALATRFGGEWVLVDARVEGVLGGSGVVVETEWVVDLARRRKIVLAGGLTPDNVAQRIRALQPHGVDVASGVEASPGVKDPKKIERFVRRARAAAGS
jgi:phosphoribosylanthranilate isomerase